MKVRKCHRECSGKVTAPRKRYLNQPHESIFKQRDLTKFYWKNHKWAYCTEQPSHKRKEVIKFLFGTSLIREGPWETEGEKEHNK